MYGMVHVFHSTGYTRYFENNMKFDEYGQRVLHHLKNDPSKKILEELVETPDVLRKGISLAVGVSGPSVSGYMKQLYADDIVSTSREGRHVRYRLNGEVAEFLRKLHSGFR